MSVTKNMTTDFDTAATDIINRLHALRFDNIDGKQNMTVWGRLLGRKDGDLGIRKDYEATLGLDDITDGCTSDEITNVVKPFFKIFERLLKDQVEDLAAESQDEGDVF